MDEKRTIIAINAKTGEKHKYKNLNEAARELGVSYQSVRAASFEGGLCKGWRIYPSPMNIRRRMKIMEIMLEEIEK